MRNIFVSAYTSLPSPAVAVHIERKIFGVSSGGSISQVTGHGSQVTGHGSRVTGHGSHVTGHRSRVTGHRSQVTGHRSQVTGRGSRVTGRGSQVSVYSHCTHENVYFIYPWQNNRAILIIYIGSPRSL